MLNTSKTTLPEIAGTQPHGDRAGAPGARPLDLLRAQYGNTLACIRCGLCHSVCPTYQLTKNEAESPRGRIAMARALIEGHVDPTPDLIAHEESCLLCDACTTICPSGFRMEPLGTALRTVFAERKGQGRAGTMTRMVLDLTLGSGSRFRAASRTLGWLRRSGAQGIAQWTGLLRLLGLGRAAELAPSFDGSFLTPSGQVWKPEGPVRARVALFTGCIMSTAFARVHRATIDVLTANGCEVVAPAGQECCGSLHVHQGYPAGAKALAQRNLAAFNPNEFDAIIVNAGGCGAMLKGYGEFLADDVEAEAAGRFVAKVRDIAEFLHGLGLRPPTRSVPMTVTYQEPCHLANVQRIREAPRRLLAQVPGLRLTEMRDAAMCCGSAGIYNLTHADMADRLLDRKLDNALATGASIIVTANPGCHLQLEAGIRRRKLPLQVKHLVEVLAEAYKGVASPSP